MKKIVLLIALITGLFAGDTVVPPNEKYRLNTQDIAYQYDFKKKKCEAPNFSYKTTVINTVRAEEALITEKYINDAGVTYIINYEYNGSEYRIALMDSYGECRLFEDIMIKGLDVKSASYKGMKENATKPVR